MKWDNGFRASSQAKTVGNDQPRPRGFRDVRVPTSTEAILIGNIVPGVFTPVLAKHSKSFSLIDCIAVGVDRMQRNFEPMRQQGRSLAGV